MELRTVYLLGQSRGAGSPHSAIMPTPALCRPSVEGVVGRGDCRLGVGIITASRGRRGAGSGGRYRPGLAASGLVRSIACCLWVMSACR